MIHVTLTGSSTCNTGKQMNKLYKWKVCPIQGRQLKDVSADDLWDDNNFRICKTYKSGGGYDKFPHIAKRRGLLQSDMFGRPDTQFVVQLQGCHLRCPYCYVTRDGIYGKTEEYDSYEVVGELLAACAQHKTGVLHLMGGAPALYLSHWPSLLHLLNGKFLFHSDLLLTEHNYTVTEIENINQPNALYAVNIKGVMDQDYFENTGRTPKWDLFWRNLSLIHSVGLNFYLTFTAPDPFKLPLFKQELIKRYGESILDDSFIIDIKQYDALEGGPAW